MASADAINPGPPGNGAAQAAGPSPPSAVATGPPLPEAPPCSVGGGARGGDGCSGGGTDEGGEARTLPTGQASPGGASGGDRRRRSSSGPKRRDRQRQQEDGSDGEGEVAPGDAGRGRPSSTTDGGSPARDQGTGEKRGGSPVNGPAARDDGRQGKAAAATSSRQASSTLPQLKSDDAEADTPAARLSRAASLAATAALSRSTSEDLGGGQASTPRHQARGPKPGTPPLPSTQQQQRPGASPAKRTGSPGKAGVPPRIPNGKLPAQVPNGCTLGTLLGAASGTGTVEAQASTPLTRDLLRRFGLDMGAVNGALGPDQARLREQLMRLTPEVVPDQILAQLAAAAAGSAGGGGFDDDAVGSKSLAAEQQREPRKEQQQRERPQTHKPEEEGDQQKQQQLEGARDLSEHSLQHQHENQQHHHRHHHHHHHQHANASPARALASIESMGALSEQSAPPAPSGAGQEPSEEGWQPVVNRRAASRAAAVAADRSDTMSDPGTYTGPLRELGGRHHGRVARERGAGRGMGAAAGAARAERGGGPRPEEQAVRGGGAVGGGRADSRQAAGGQQQQMASGQQPGQRRGGGGGAAAVEGPSAGSAAPPRAGGGWGAAGNAPVQGQSGGAMTRRPPGVLQVPGSGAQWGGRNARLLHSPRSLPAQSPCRSMPGTPATQKQRGLPPAPSPAPMMLPPAALGGASTGAPSPLGAAAGGLCGGALAAAAAAESGRIPSCLLGLDPAPAATDLERFVAAACPPVPLARGVSLAEALRRLTLGDVWSAFMDASLVGCPVATLGGVRGPSTAYFVPYLSGMQVFVEPQAVVAGSSGGGSAEVAASQDLQPQRKADVPAGSWAAVAAGGTRTVTTPAATAVSTVSSATGSAAGGASGGSSPGSSSGAGGGASGCSAGSSTPRSACSVSGAPPPVLPVGVTNAGRLYACDVEGWPPMLQVLCEHMEHELPFYREPLSLQLETMAAPPPANAGGAPGGGPGSGRPPAVGPALSDARLVDLHPASWFAVAWYPVYRIPDAPLTARFLVFYSLAAPLQLLAEAEAAEASGAAPPPALRSLRLPVVGLKWCDMRGERWFEPFARRATADGDAAEDEGDSSCSSGSDSDASDGEGSDKEEEKQEATAGAGGAGSAIDGASAGSDSSTAASGSGSCGGGTEEHSGAGPPAAGAAGTTIAGSAPEAPAVAASSTLPSASASPVSSSTTTAAGSCWSPTARTAELRARLAELQTTAERLARGSWLTVIEPQGPPRTLKLYHSDFEFFNSRGG